VTTLCRNLWWISRVVHGMYLGGLPKQGCQMVFFLTKNPNFGKFWIILQWKMLVNFTTVRSILLPFCILYGNFVYFVMILVIFTVLVCCTKKNLVTLLCLTHPPYVCRYTYFFAWNVWYLHITPAGAPNPYGELSWGDRWSRHLQSVCWNFESRQFGRRHWNAKPFLQSKQKYFWLPGTDVMIFKNIFAEKISKKWRF
jgi:hypothetical protein